MVKTPRLSVIEEVVPPGSSEVKHLHRDTEQFIYILSGLASIELDELVHRLSVGQGLHVSAGMPHQLRNEDSEKLEFIVVSTPPSRGDRVEIKY